MNTPTGNLKELLAQQAALNEQIENMRLAERANARIQIDELISTFGFTSEELFGSVSRKPKKASKKVEPKFRDPATGATWSGRGMAPGWIAGRDRAAFAIQ